jgi:hypothetical protein
MPLRKHQETLEEQRIRRRNCLWALGSILLLDESVEDKTLALVAIKVGQDTTRDRRIGPRGPHNAINSQDFFIILINDFTDRYFKSWMRYVAASSSKAPF